MRKTRTWGGRRARAGRKRAALGKRTVRHARRERFAGLTPLHVTVKVVKGTPTLRSSTSAKALKKAFRGGRERFGFRLVHFSVMTNHMHFVVEADDSVALSRGMKGLLVRCARLLNAAHMRRGHVFAERYHARAIQSTLDVKNTLAYVLCNARKHGIRFDGIVDPYSSAAWFNGWCHGLVTRPEREPPTAEPKSWQLKNGWWPHGRLDPRRVPGPTAW